ncbi:MAG: sucrase ferredoxin [Synechococcales cyanobacterium RM1_1_8]|nr:sucrase ferredoxin [Synechococcales cyanobacterium RM1_1_8]
MVQASPLNQTDCRYCSVVSKAKCEDPIGSAIVADQWLLIETPRPWGENPWEKQPDFASALAVLDRVKPSMALWDSLRVQAIAPDLQYSQPGYVHVFYYQRPAAQFSNYEKQAYCLPLEDVATLLEALLFEPQNLVSFAPHQRNATHLREILVCTHTQVDLACGRFGMPLYKELKRDYANIQTLRVWQTSHFGGHRFAPTLIDFPSGRFWGHLESQHLEALVHHRGDLDGLQKCYRGWSGFSRWEQMAEREVWKQLGWHWLECDRSGEVLSLTLGSLSKQLLYTILRRLPGQFARNLRQKLASQAIRASVKLNFNNCLSQDSIFEVNLSQIDSIDTPEKSSEESSKPRPQYTASLLE